MPVISRSVSSCSLPPLKPCFPRRVCGQVSPPRRSPIVQPHHSLGASYWPCSLPNLGPPVVCRRAPSPDTVIKCGMRPECQAVEVRTSRHADIPGARKDTEVDWTGMHDTSRMCVGEGLGGEQGREREAKREEERRRRGETQRSGERKRREARGGGTKELRRRRRGEEEKGEEGEGRTGLQSPL